MSPLRLAGAFVDVPKSDHARAVEFWTAALGKTPEVTEKFPDYAQYDDVSPGLYFMVQATQDDTRRVHIDVESDDRDADVARLLGLGATEVMRSHHWAVLRDPAGTTFCVVQKLAEQPPLPEASPSTGGHRSRLCAAYIDVPRAEFEKAVEFWRQTLGRDPKIDPDDPDYASFGHQAPGVELGVQSVGDPTPRIHLDIETDDREAEVTRLVGLGATEKERIHSWIVMRDPVGITFCVIKVQDAEWFEKYATSWPAG